MAVFKSVVGSIAMLILCVLVAEPGVALAASTQLGRARLEGELVQMLGEDFETGRSQSWYAVQTPSNNFVRADVSRLRHVDRLVGEQVALEGALVGTEFVATQNLEDAQDSATSTTSSSQRTAIILLNFTNDRSQPWSSTFVANTVFGDTASVNAYYREVSYGTTSISGTVVGWLNLAYDNSGCRYSEWGQAALAAAHVDPTEYAHVVYAFPRTPDCSWAGLSTVGGRYSWINGFMTVRTVGHELAHSMGVHHASSMNCTGNGARVTWSTACTRSEYGDPFSIMGTGTRHLNNWHRAQIGWVTEMQTLTSSGSYSVAPTELTAQPRLVRIARGDGNYLYLEYRRPFGAYDNFATSSAAVNGVTIRVAPDKPTRRQSLLLDMTPSTAGFDDAPLALGRSFTDPLSGIRVTTTAVSASGATVSVSWPGTAMPPASPTSSPSPTSSLTPTSSPSAGPSTPPSSSPAPTTSPTSSPPSSPTSPPPTPSPTPSPSPSAATTGLTAPRHVRAVRLDGRMVRVTWNRSLGTVAGYRVFRNGKRIRQTTYLRIYDRVPVGIIRVRYAVRAFDRWGNVGPASMYYIYVR